jgi:hypothetical protein
MTDGRVLLRRWTPSGRFLGPTSKLLLCFFVARSVGASSRLLFCSAMLGIILVVDGANATNKKKIKVVVVVVVVLGSCGERLFFLSELARVSVR